MTNNGEIVMKRIIAYSILWSVIIVFIVLFFYTVWIEPMMYIMDKGTYSVMELVLFFVILNIFWALLIAIAYVVVAVVRWAVRQI